MGQMNVPHWKNWMACIKTPREAHQRDRDLRAILDRLHAGEPLDALQDAPGLGREELDGRAEGRAPALEGAVPGAVEARSLG